MSRRQDAFKKWGLTDNPFTSLPPNTERDRKRVFTGRENEINTLLDLIKRPRGIFLVGIFGIGKSMLLLELLRQLKDQGETILYVKFSGQDGFGLSILKRLCREYGSSNRRKISKILNNCVKGDNIFNGIEDVLAIIKKQDQIVTIVVDDLDKEMDLQSLNTITQDTRQLVELGCAVILPGHPVGITAGFGSSADILYPLALESLSGTKLMEMMGKYLSLARIETNVVTNLTYPFTIDAANLIARSIAEFELTPRIFNFAAQLLLEQAASDGLDVIDEHYVTASWSRIAENYLIKSLRREDRRHLEVIYGNGGIVSEDTREVIKQISGDFAEYYEVRNVLVRLIQKNVLIEDQQDGKRQIKTSPLLGGNDFFIVR